MIILIVNLILRVNVKYIQMIFVHQNSRLDIMDLFGQSDDIFGLRMSFLIDLRAVFCNTDDIEVKVQHVLHEDRLRPHNPYPYVVCFVNVTSTISRWSVFNLLCAECINDKHSSG